MILAIEPKTYKYIDRISRGDKKVYGFIAQQIKEIIPEAIKIEPSYIPNIYIMADYNAGIITFQLQPTKVIIKLKLGNL
jgi:precorrin-4 methylase